MGKKRICAKIVPGAGLLLMVLFTYTAVSKLVNLGTFQLRLEQMPYLSSHAQAISWAIPFMELVIVGFLLIPKYRTMGLYASMGLLGLFTSYILVLLNSSSDLPCSCGGILSTLGWKQHALFNGAFMAVALVAIIIDKIRTKATWPHQNTT